VDTSNDNIPYGYCHCGCGQKTRVPTSNNTEKGWIKGQPLAFINHHNAHLQKSEPLAERFWKKVHKGGDDECWIWQGRIDKNGYGRIDLSRQDKNRLAHRLSYTLTHGSIPDGLDILHQCDNPACVNPSHLFPGTHKQNMEDRARKGRGIRGQQWYDALGVGEDNPNARLSNTEVAEARALWESGAFTQTAIAKRLNVDQSHISNIIRGKSRRYG